jgi:Uma2 family endonuclease
MPVAITEVQTQPPPSSPPRKRWTREECSLLESSGILNLRRIELIDGELITKMGKNTPHMVTLAVLMKWLAGVFGMDNILQEPTIDVSPQDNPTNAPEPDAVVLFRPWSELKRSAFPQSENIALIVEVSDTSLRFDLNVKARLYARAGIQEYWVFDIAGARLIVHRQPSQQDGRYLDVVAYGEQESAAPIASPGAEFQVQDAFR